MKAIPHVPLPVSSLRDSELLKEDLNKRRNAVPAQTTKAYGGSGGTAAPVLNLLTSCTCCCTHGTKECRNPSNTRLGGPYLFSGYLGEKIRNWDLQVSTHGSYLRKQVKVKQYLYRPGQAMRVPVGRVSQNS